MRSGSERINGRLKDEFGGRHVRVRGYDKVLAHLMFGMMRLIVPPCTSCKTVRPNAPEVWRKYRIGGCANADPTMVAIKIAPIAVRRRRC